MVDPRGPRFGAGITTLVLVVVLITGSGWLLLAQAVVFALGATGLRRQPYGVAYRRVVRPRLGPPAELEPDEPPRFAQAVGLGFAALGVAGYASGVTALGAGATALALGAAFLNVAFDFCLGCQMYLLARRVRAHTPRLPRRTATPAISTTATPTNTIPTNRGAPA